jgi:Flp pilus assembly protein TadG
MPEHNLLVAQSSLGGRARHRRDSGGAAFLRRLAAMLAGPWRAADGTSAVEFALLAPVFFAFLLGIEEFGRALWTQSALQFAVEAGARCATTSCNADIPAYAATQALGMSIPSSAFTYNSGQSCGIAGYSSGYQVTASYAFQSLVGSLQFLPQLNVTLNAKSCHP